MQVYLTASNTWANVIEQDRVFIKAKDVDGIMVYVIKDGQEITRSGEL